MEIPFANIDFQEGSTAEKGVNGCKVNDIIDVLLRRLSTMTQHPYNAKDIALACNHLREAKSWINEP